jgi:D-alanyl-D-alanine carboxypeptidase
VIVVLASMLMACGEKVFDKQLANQLQTVLDAAVEKSENMINGTLLYVNSPELGTWTGASGVRSIETNTAARPNDKFRGGSIMKPFASVVILQLVEEGRLSLDDPMTKVLPASVADKFTNSGRITVRMLLNHTAGIPEWLGEAQINEIGANPTKIWKVEEYLDLAAAQEPYFEPGEGLIYSNTDYNLLGLVIEQATGSTWREEVRERIIEELNLENTLLPEPGEIFIPDDHIRGYLPMGGQLIDATGIDPSMAGAAGGHALVTTASDLTIFLDAVLEGELFQNTGTLEEMMTFKETDPYGMPSIPGVEWEYYGYGLGLEKWVLPSGVELIGHAGTTAGFSATVYYLPAQDITIALAWNIQELREFFIRMIFPTLDILVPEFNMPEPAPASAATYNDLVITLERTPCHGFCPVYKLTIDGDGTVVYEGIDFVSTKNREETTISREKIEQLIEEFESIDYFSLNDKYTELTITDAPSAITSITLGGKTKTIEHYHGDFSAPEELTELEDKIDEIVNSEQWIK